MGRCADLTAAKVFAKALLHYGDSNPPLPHGLQGPLHPKIWNQADPAGQLLGQKAEASVLTEKTRNSVTGGEKFYFLRISQAFGNATSIEVTLTRNDDVTFRRQVTVLSRFRKS